jgi:hypothetical protein
MLPSLQFENYRDDHAKLLANYMVLEVSRMSFPASPGNSALALLKIKSRDELCASIVPG